MGERDRAQLQVWQEKVRIRSQGAGWRLVAGKLRENIKDKSRTWLSQPNMSFTEAKPGWSHVTWRMVQDRELN